MNGQKKVNVIDKIKIELYNNDQNIKQGCFTVTCTRSLKCSYIMVTLAPRGNYSSQVVHPLRAGS